MRKAIRQLSPYLMRHAGPVSLGLGSLLAKDVFSAALPLVIGSGIDALTHGFHLATLMKFAALLVGLSLAKGLFQYWMRVILIGVSRDVEYDIRNDLFAAAGAPGAGFLRAMRARATSWPGRRTI